MGSGNWTEWSDDVLSVLRLMGMTRGSVFNLQQAYSGEALLKRIHPNNSHIKAKIRQQLQILQENDYVRFIDNKGNYEMLK